MMSALFYGLAIGLAVAASLVILPSALGLVPVSVFVNLDRVGAESPRWWVRAMLCSNIGNACRGAQRGSTFHRHLLASLMRSPSFVHCLPGGVQLASGAALGFYLLGRVFE